MRLSTITTVTLTILAGCLSPPRPARQASRSPPQQPDLVPAAADTLQATRTA